MWIFDILVFNLTIVFVVELALGCFFGARTPVKILSLALINVITNPTIVMCMLSITLFFNKYETIGLVVLEVGVFFLEGFLFSKYKLFNKNSPYFVSAVLNLSSFLAGNIIETFL